eukprot:g1302.t1
MHATIFFRSSFLDRSSFSTRINFPIRQTKRRWLLDSRHCIYASITVQEVQQSTLSTDEITIQQSGFNKGKRMTEEDVEDNTRNSLKGRIPWNKGKKLSPKTREKMRLAKLGTRHSMASRRKMSVSHTGMGHSSETMRLLSKKLSNLPKTSEHRKKISTSQKRRHAVNKALKAIEAAHKLAGPIHEDPKTLPISSSAYLTQSISRKSLSREKKTRSEVLNMYKALLKEYRCLQKELKPWMTAFEAKNFRKPHLVDVEATQIFWLISNFKNYLLLRDKLLRDIPFLRNAMKEAPEHKLNAENLDLKDQVPFVSHTYIEEMKSEQKSPDERMRKLSASNEASERIRKAMSAALEYKKTNQASSKAPKPANQIMRVKKRAIDAIKRMEATQ